MYRECESINMCIGEAYCKDCKKKEYYNSNNLLTRPSICQHCGGEMTNYQTEKFMELFRNSLEKTRKQIKNIRKKNRTKKDQFVIDLLESLKENFINDNEYYGSVIKLIINGYIKRME